MPGEFSFKKKEASKTRKVPILPRFGIVIDVAGYELIYKRVPLLETLVIIFSDARPTKRIANVLKQQFAEVQFPLKKAMRTLSTTHRTISVKPS